MTDTFPNGYGNRLVTLQELRERHEPKMHPEYARRIFACVVASDGLVGIGGGWRSTATQAKNHAKAPNTFAPPGSSFHEAHTWASGVEAFAAVDTVGRHAQHQQAWNWMRDNAGRFGLCTFWNVNGEPWHTQFADLPKGAKSWKSAGRPDPPRFDVPGDDGNTASATPRSAYGDFPANDAKPDVSLGWHGDLVTYVQRVISDHAGGRIAIDGDFGPQTLGRVKDVQHIADLATTGVVDWQGTWQFVDHLAGYDRTPTTTSSEPAAHVEDVQDGFYWVRRGDSPWAIAERVFGDGTRHREFDPPRPAEPGFAAADHAIQIAGLAGRTTTVVHGDAPRTLIERLYPDRPWSDLSARFVDLNGGEHRTLLPGDVVFLDEPD